MKKILIAFLILAVTTGCTPKETQNENIQNHISINETESDTDIGYNNIITDEHFIHLNNYEMNAIFTENDDNFTGVVVMSKESCQWCRRLIPVIYEYAVANDKQIYYIDTDAVKGEENFDPDIAFNNVSENIQELLIEAGAPVDDNGQALLRIPLIVTFNNGTPLEARLGVLDGYDDTDIPLTYDQKGQIQKDLDQFYLISKKGR